MTIKLITEEEKKKVLKKLYDIFNVELDRYMLASSQDKINILTWVLEEYQNRKWGVTHTRQVLMRDFELILSNSLYRDFIIGITQRFVSECIVFNDSNVEDDFYKRFVNWRVETSAIFTIDKPPEERFTLLNMEVFETLQVDKVEYRRILEDNPWLLVYGVLLEYIHEWGEYQSFMKSIVSSKNQAGE